MSHDGALWRIFSQNNLKNAWGGGSICCHTSLVSLTLVILSTWTIRHRGFPDASSYWAGGVRVHACMGWAVRHVRRQ